MSQCENEVKQYAGVGVGGVIEKKTKQAKIVIWKRSAL